MKLTRRQLRQLIKEGIVSDAIKAGDAKYVDAHFDSLKPQLLKTLNWFHSDILPALSGSETGVSVTDDYFAPTYNKDGHILYTYITETMIVTGTGAESAKIRTWWQDADIESFRTLQEIYDDLLRMSKDLDVAIPVNENTKITRNQLRQMIQEATTEDEKKVTLSDGFDYTVHCDSEYVTKCSTGSCEAPRYFTDFDGEDLKTITGKCLIKMNENNKMKRIINEAVHPQAIVLMKWIEKAGISQGDAYSALNQWQEREGTDSMKALSFFIKRNTPEQHKLWKDALAAMSNFRHGDYGNGTVPGLLKFLDDTWTLPQSMGGYGKKLADDSAGNELSQQNEKIRATIAELIKEINEESDKALREALGDLAGVRMAQAAFAGSRVGQAAAIAGGASSAPVVAALIAANVLLVTRGDPERAEEMLQTWADMDPTGVLQVALDAGHLYSRHGIENVLEELPSATLRQLGLAAKAAAEKIEKVEDTVSAASDKVAIVGDYWKDGIAAGLDRLGDEIIKNAALDESGSQKVSISSSEPKHLSEVRQHVRNAINEMMVGLTPITRIDTQRNANNAKKGNNTNTGIDTAEIGFNTFDMQEWASIAGITENTGLSEHWEDDGYGSNVVDLRNPLSDESHEIPGMISPELSEPAPCGAHRAPGPITGDTGHEDEVDNMGYDFERFLVGLEAQDDAGTVRIGAAAVEGDEYYQDEYTEYDGEDEFNFTGDVGELDGDSAFAIGLEAGKRGLDDEEPRG